MKKALILKLIIGIIYCCSFQSCITSSELNYLQDIKSSYTYQPFNEYKLSVGDLVSCRILTGDVEFSKQFNSLISSGRGESKTFSIYEDGNVYLPYLNAVNIEGLTIQEAEKKVETEVQQSIIDAQVQLTMASNMFYVLADGKRGSFTIYKDNMTIYQALAISNQTTNNMDLSKINIVRKREDGSTDLKVFDLRSESVVQSEYYYIQPNDVIYFPMNKNSFFNITSVGGFVSAVTIPLTFLIYVSTYNFK